MTTTQIDLAILGGCFLASAALCLWVNWRAVGGSVRDFLSGVGFIASALGLAVFSLWFVGLCLAGVVA